MLFQPAGDLIGAEDGRVDLEPRQVGLVAAAAPAAAGGAPGRPSGKVW